MRAKVIRMKRVLILFLTLGVAACNSMYIKPDTMVKNQTVYATRGGYSMRRSIKERLESRGYHVIVGKMKSHTDFSNDDSDIELAREEVPSDVRYVVKVAERREKVFAFWCPFNGWWWWNFNVSIADQQTGEELMTWRGRGCANSSLRKLDAALDKLEME